MQTIVIDVPDVCQSVTRLHAASLCKTAERIEVLFGMKTLEGERSIVLDGVPDQLTVSGGGFDAALLWPLVQPVIRAFAVYRVMR